MTAISAKTWRRIPLGSLGEFRNGVNFTKDQKGDGIRLINVKDIFQGAGRILFDSLDLVSLKDKRGIEAYYVREKDLFFVRSSVKRDGVGLVGIAQRGDNQTVHCGFVIRFRLTNPEANPYFLVYLLRSPLYRQKIISISGGSAITNISQDSLASLEIPLPPLPTQCKIAAILSAYDDLIENNTRRIKILEEMAQTIYREWFVNFRVPGHKKTEFITGHVGQLPKGWRMDSITEVPQLRFIGENVKPYNGEKLYYATADVQGISIVGQGEWYVYQTKPSRAQKQPVPNSVWFARMKESHKVLCFIDVNWNEASRLLLSSGFAGFEAANGWLSFLYYTINTVEFHRLKDQFCTGTTQMSLTNEGLAKIQVIVPTEEIVKEYDTVVHPMIDEILTLQKKNTNLRCARDLLLPRLISGEIDVENLDIETEGLGNG